MAIKRRNPPARYILPAVPQPEDFVCYPVQVPNDIGHIVAFKSQIRALSRAYTWADDADHTALLAAAAWEDTAESIDLDTLHCGIVPPSKLCISGSFADDAYGYVPDIAAPCSPSWEAATGWVGCTDSGDNKEKLELMRIFDNATYIRSAEYHMVSQVGQTYDYEVIFWLAGSNVADFTGTVTGGGGFTFSETVNQQSDRVTIHLAETPTTTGNHPYIDDWSLCFTGDFPLAEGQESFSHTFDFTLADGGFNSPSIPPYLQSVWTTGQGWVGQSVLVDGAWVVLNLIERLFSTRYLTAIELWYSSNVVAFGGTRSIRLRKSGTTTTTLTLNSGSGSFHDTFSIGALYDEIWPQVDIGGGGNSANQTIISKLIISGQGTDPF